MERGPTHPLLVLEGNDGSGKTSLRKHLFKDLRARGYDILTVTPFSWRDVRVSEVIVNAKFHQQDYARETITRAYVRDKELLCDEIVAPHLEFRNVVTDRYVASDMVYHHVIWGIDPETTYAAYCRSRVLPPTLTFFIDVPPETAQARKLARGSGGHHRWDELARQKRIYEQFQEILFGDRFPWLGEAVRVDNSGDLEDTKRRLVELCLQRFPKPGDGTA